MSRIGAQPVTIPAGVTVAVDGQVVKATGPKGELSLELPRGISVQLADGQVTVARSDDSKPSKSLHGLIRSLISNLVIGVNEGYSKQLEINGVGFKVAVSGQKMTLSLGFSHDVNYDLPTGVTATVEQNIITISGIDKQQVGQVAAEIRALRKPEPYKGKGIRYVDEYVIRKAGKAAAGGKE